MNEVRRVRIWDSGSPEIGFGAAVFAFAAQVDLGHGTTLVLQAPNAGRPGRDALVVFAHGPRAREAEQAWLRFAAAGSVPTQPQEAAEAFVRRQAPLASVEPASS
jgi:hypothetical protein